MMAVYESDHPVKLTKSVKTNRAEFLFLFIERIVMTTITNPERLLCSAISDRIEDQMGNNLDTYIAKMNCDARLSHREKNTLNASVATAIAQPTRTVCHRSMTKEGLLRFASPTMKFAVTK